jgi:hypothetical protein
MSFIKPSKGVKAVHPESIQWHAKMKGISEDEVKDSLEKAPNIEVVWPKFVDYVTSYRTNKTMWGLPVIAGHNILKYDCIIANRLDKAHGIDKNYYHPRDEIDTMKLVFPWLENNQAVNSLSLDNLRIFFGIETKGAHDALKDCLDCGLIIKRFLKYHRYLTDRKDNNGKKVLDFQNSFKDWNDDE